MFDVFRIYEAIIGALRDGGLLSLEFSTSFVVDCEVSCILFACMI